MSISNLKHDRKRDADDQLSRIREEGRPLGAKESKAGGNVWMD